MIFILSYHLNKIVVEALALHSLLYNSSIAEVYKKLYAVAVVYDDNNSSNNSNISNSSGGGEDSDHHSNSAG